MDPWDENTPESRSAYLAHLDEELLPGVVDLSEWTRFIVGAVNEAFVAGAWLPALLTAVSALETHLRVEMQTDAMPLHALIEQYGISRDLREEIHALRRLRNAYVHVDAPWEDGIFEWHSDSRREALREEAFDAMRTLRQVLYYWQLGGARHPSCFA